MKFIEKNTERAFSFSIERKYDKIAGVILIMTFFNKNTY